MAISESIQKPDHRNHLTRRRALVSTAACGALALPAGAAVAAAPDQAATGVQPSLLRLWEERQAIAHALENVGRQYDQNWFDAENMRCNSVDDEILTHPVLSVADLAVQMRCLIASLEVDGRDCSGPTLIGEVDNDPASGYNFLRRTASWLEAQADGGRS
jgi:hypothetical protein